MSLIDQFSNLMKGKEKTAQESYREIVLRYGNPLPEDAGKLVALMGELNLTQADLEADIATIQKVAAAQKEVDRYPAMLHKYNETSEAHNAALQALELAKIAVGVTSGQVTSCTEDPTCKVTGTKQLAPRIYG